MSPDQTPNHAEPPKAEGPLRRTAVECLVGVARHYELNVSLEQLVHENALPPEEPSTQDLVRLARKVGLKARGTRLTWEKLIKLGNVFPVLVRTNDGNTMIVVGVRPGEPDAQLGVIDPLLNKPNPMLMSREEFTARWQGDVILLRRVYHLTELKQPFGLRWFIPELMLQATAFRDVAIAAVILHFMGLVSPIYFQLVIDKVLSHNSWSTLYVLTIGVIIAILFEEAFSFIRRYLLLAATNKIDIRLNTRTFSHLLSLPIHYFEQISAGVTLRHMQQVEKIRGFLTGRLLLTALDATTLIIYLPILLLYSLHLTVLVLMFTALMALVIGSMIGPFRRRLTDLYNADAQRQAMLVETIHGMRTVKSSAIEPIQRRKWEQKAANTIHMQFRVARMGLTGQAITQILQKVMGVSLIAFGTSEVFDQTLTVGALIAFQMFSQRVVSPLVQIVGLVQDYQETALSVTMLGHVMNHAPERPPGQVGLAPPIQGNLEFDRVRFRYIPENPPALDNICLRIPAGAVVGIVGKSGSGKTTLTRMIQGLYVPQEGIIRFDGTDMREIDLSHLRRSIGVVLQENFLFRGTVRENLSITRPGAPLEEVAKMAKLSGADEFIEKLPQGYDTQIEENAANLSGGQRQRLAIARALLNRPRLLILDEATSALDPDSEAIFMDNLAGIAAGRTVLIVSHRLTTLVKCTAIIVMEQGRIVDAGTHGELLQRCPIYTHLWKQQNRHHM